MIPLQPKTKLMVFVDWYDPGYKAGGQIRSIKNLVETLDDTFDIYIVTSDNDMGDESLYHDIEKNTWVKVNLHQVIYLSHENVKIGFLRQLIKQVKPDVIYLNSMFSIGFTLKPILCIQSNDFRKIKVILSPRGMLQNGAMQFKYFKKRLFLWILKRTGFVNNIIFHATDENEKKDILNYFGELVTIKSIPDFFASQQPPLNIIEKKKDSLIILFVSRITDKKNLHFALKILADTEPHSSIHFNIVGPIESEEYWDSCKRVIDKMPAHVKVQYSGAVHPSLLHDYYKASHLFFLPTHGENFGHVIFDALMYSRPVLISDQTPWKNLLENKCGADLRLDQPSAFSAFINNASFWEQQDFEEYCTHAWSYAHHKLQSTNLKLIYTELFSHG